MSLKRLETRGWRREAGDAMLGPLWGCVRLWKAPGPGWGEVQEGGWPGLNQDGMLQRARDAPSYFGVFPKGL